eukprot:GFKZ01006295.1.p2 GENE.GFKZ01006295.1~~GFKZ01006295.1.p2  ORF type:complete len:356 (+),score=37.67 GFKZ01006295.1:626-1693(+)
MTYRLYPRRHRPLRVPPTAASVFSLFFAVLALLLLFVSTIVDLRNRMHAQSDAQEAHPAPHSSTLVVTVSNWMYREHLANFACNLKNIGVKGLVVYALDRRTAEFASYLGLASVLLSDEDGDDVKPGNFEPTGSRSFNSITKRKLEAVKAALKSGFDVLLSDADIFWCQDAVAVLKSIMSEPRYNDSDVIIQAEVGYRTLNSGFYYVRAGERSMSLFDQLISNIHLGAHDQDVVNKVFCDDRFGGSKIPEPTGTVPFRCESHGATIRVLPSERFPSGAEPYNGQVLFKKSRVELRSMCRKELVVVHNNFVRASKKKARFVQKGMWYTEFYGEKPICHSEPVPENPGAARTCGVYC